MYWDKNHCQICGVYLPNYKHGKRPLCERCARTMPDDGCKLSDDVFIEKRNREWKINLKLAKKRNKGEI